MTEDSLHRDRAWAVQIQQGDRAAFNCLFDAYYGPLCDFAFHYTGTAESAEDLVQDLFVWLWNHRLDWTPGISVRAYLYRSVKNRSLNYLKTRQSHQVLEHELGLAMSQSPETPFDDLHYGEVADAIKKALDQLPERRRLILSMHLIDGLTYREIGAVLEISVNTVDTQIRRGLALMRERLAVYIPSATVRRNKDGHEA